MAKLTLTNTDTPTPWCLQIIHNILEIKQSVEMHFWWFCQKLSTVMNLPFALVFWMLLLLFGIHRNEPNQTGFFKQWFNLNHLNVHLNWYWRVLSPGNEFLWGGMSAHYLWILCLEVYYMFIKVECILISITHLVMEDIDWPAGQLKFRGPS